ncbi:MAG: hypothetical protein OJF58_001471 [Enhydrobacter sp.]|jgi:hypothetical protein|nr:MAG: hypothetical protein OJF58_001471 [Enhydrobacter sp.]
MEIDLKLLQHAVVLACHRHFGRAAAALQIRQPTLSRNIAALEKKVGVRIFERLRRDIAATPAGDDVLKMADELIARAKAMSSKLQLVRAGRGGRLRVALGTFIADITVNDAASIWSAPSRPFNSSSWSANGPRPWPCSWPTASTSPSSMSRCCAASRRCTSTRSAGWTASMYVAPVIHCFVNGR